MTGTAPLMGRRTALLAAGATALAVGCGRNVGEDGDGSSSDTAPDTAAQGGPAGRELTTTDAVPWAGA